MKQLWAGLFSWVSNNEALFPLNVWRNDIVHRPRELMMDCCVFHYGINFIITFKGKIFFIDIHFILFFYRFALHQFSNCSKKLILFLKVIKNGLLYKNTYFLLSFVFKNLGLLYITGAMLYAFRIPERIFPGKVDILVSYLHNNTH